MKKTSGAMGTWSRPFKTVEKRLEVPPQGIVHVCGHHGTKLRHCFALESCHANPRLDSSSYSPERCGL